MIHHPHQPPQPGCRTLPGVVRRVPPDPERFGDLDIGQPAIDELHDIAFPLGQAADFLDDAGGWMREDLQSLQIVGRLTRLLLISVLTNVMPS
jgi:hypothetical protein